MAQKLNVGIIGLGKLGKIRADLLERIPSVGEISFVDPVTKAHKAYRRHESVGSLLADKNLAAVIVSSPNAFFRDIVTKALACGKHVFCEKPPGTSLAEAKAMSEAAKAHAPLLLKFGFNHRYLAHYRELKEALDTQAHGKVLWVKATYGKGYDQNFSQNWRSDKKLSGGGILIDQGIHALDLLLDLLGDLSFEYGIMDSLTWGSPDIEDNAFLLFRAKGGIPVSVQSSMNHWKHTLRIEVATEKSLFELTGVKSSTRSYGDETLTVYSNWRDNFVETRSRIHNEPDYYTLQAELEEFVAAVSGSGKITKGTPSDAVRIMALLEEIYSKARRGK